MFIKERMTPNPITIQASASITELVSLMKERSLKKVPVLDKEKLVGIVTEKDIERVSPSAATTLSVFEINYLLAKAKVKEAMTKDVLTCEPNAYIEDAALLMRQHRINCLCVVENEKLVGIVTESDLFDALISMMGGREKGNRIVLDVDNVPGVLSKIGRHAEDLGLNITHFAMTKDDQNGHCELLITTDGEEKFEQLVEDMKQERFRVISAKKRS